MKKIIITLLKYVSKFTNSLIKYLSLSLKFKTIKNILKILIKIMQILKKNSPDNSSNKEEEDSE